MTNRRAFLAYGAGALGTALLAGCGRSHPRPPAAPRPSTAALADTLLVDTTQGVVLVHGGVLDTIGTAVPTPYGDRLFVTAPAGAGRTRLRTIGTGTGEVLGETVLRGDLVPRVADTTGRLVALAEAGSARAGGGLYRPTPRRRTTIVVADAVGERYRLDLAGNLEPDAFQVGTGGLFVLDWLPATAPDRYRVRSLDLTTGRFQPMLTREKVPVTDPEQMRGQGRMAVYAPGMGTLYTLYTNQAGGWGGQEAPGFVHTLDLRIGWAYCLDLPEPFGRGPAVSHTLAVTDRSVLVADLSTGRLAVADAENLVVRATVRVPTGPGTAWSAVSPDRQRLYLAAGRRVHVVDLATLSGGTGFDTGREVRGIATSRDGKRLLVGHPGGVAWYSAGDFTRLGETPVAGLVAVRRTV